MKCNFFITSIIVHLKYYELWAFSGIQRTFILFAFVEHIERNHKNFELKIVFLRLSGKIGMILEHCSKKSVIFRMIFVCVCFVGALNTLIPKCWKKKKHTNFKCTFWNNSSICLTYRSIVVTCCVRLLPLLSFPARFSLKKAKKRGNEEKMW